MLLKPSKDEVDVSQMAFLFGLIESALKSESMSERHKYIVSKDFRHICCEGLGQIIPDSELDRRAIRFKSSLVYPRAPSTLLSDYLVVGADGLYEEPLGALPHQTYQELYIKTKEKVAADLERLQSACYEDILFFKEARDKLRLLKANPAPRELIELIKKQILIKAINSKWYKERAKYNDEQIVSAYMEVYESNGGESLQFEQSQFFSKIDEILKRVVGDYTPYFKKSSLCFHIPYRCISSELQSIFMLLLCITGWNAGALIGMEKDNVDDKGGHWKLQGFKERTDDFTPSVYIESDMKSAYAAMKTLMWHRDSLVKQGLISPEEQLLWFVGSNKTSYTTQAIGIISKQNFYSRHGMPPFSFGDIRNQVFERDRLEGRNVENIRRKAGHRSRNTTVGYLDSLVSRRMFSSMNLEFSRRLESTVIFRLVESGKGSFKFDSDRVKPELFSSIGDGSYCIDKLNPPDEALVFDGVCAALTCHCSGGCKNRKIIIDNDSIADLVRKKHYYLNNWRRLESNNSASFLKYHFDAMAYVLSLYDFIKNSTYRTFLHEAEEAVENE
ncbi:hypothetical protein [Pseudomonas fluorescens]|uniref:Uncharacterized protein n=1 Tax=Pseudomonas fluorescens TaxID=294 RepID=A0A423LIB2_PSEFL|nr:hypothetical protein [Pseudomonas fluorescens]RON68049.1 hypothetical protein BK671_13990 [Pseudomonas fluorescens]